MKTSYEFYILLVVGVVAVAGICTLLFSSESTITGASTQGWYEHYGGTGSYKECTAQDTSFIVCGDGSCGYTFVDRGDECFSRETCSTCLSDCACGEDYVCEPEHPDGDVNGCTAKSYYCDNSVQDAWEDGVDCGIQYCNWCDYQRDLFDNCAGFAYVSDDNQIICEEEEEEATSITQDISDDWESNQEITECFEYENAQCEGNYNYCMAYCLEPYCTQNEEGFYTCDPSAGNTVTSCQETCYDIYLTCYESIYCKEGHSQTVSKYGISPTLADTSDKSDEDTIESEEELYDFYEGLFDEGLEEEEVGQEGAWALNEAGQWVKTDGKEQEPAKAIDIETAKQEYHDAQAKLSGLSQTLESGSPELKEAYNEFKKTKEAYFALLKKDTPPISSEQQGVINKISGGNELKPDEFITYIETLEQQNPTMSWKQIISQIHSEEYSEDVRLSIMGIPLFTNGEENKDYMDVDSLSVQPPRFVVTEDGTKIDVAHSYAGIRAGLNRGSAIGWFMTNVNTGWGDSVQVWGARIKGGLKLFSPWHMKEGASQIWHASDWKPDNQVRGNEMGKWVQGYLDEHPDAKLSDAYTTYFNTYY